MKPPIRLSALMELPVIYVFTHDSIGVGEDGPTHQPVEQLIALRSIPGLITIRPADANEVAEAWRIAIGLKHQPASLVLSRQPLPTIERTRYASAAGVSRGAYILADAESAKPSVILIGTGSEVALCIKAYGSSRRKAFQHASSACRPGNCSSCRIGRIVTASFRPMSRRAFRSKWDPQSAGIAMWA
jgi:transketolase